MERGWCGGGVRGGWVIERLVVGGGRKYGRNHSWEKPLKAVNDDNLEEERKKHLNNKGRFIFKITKDYKVL